MSQFCHSKFLSLPNELLCLVIRCIDDSKTSLEMLRVCKRIYSLFDARTRSGQSIWKSIRENEGWPDPQPIGLSDYAFIRAYYGRGCRNCVHHPRLRTPIWAFSGMRLCKACFKRLTIRDYQLTVPDKWCEHLPYVQPSPTFYYKCYLRSQIPQSRSSSYTRELGFSLQRNVELFTELMKFQGEVVSAKRRQLVLDNQDLRKEEINTWLQINMGTVHPNFYSKFDTYHNAIQRTTPFTSRAQTIFRRKFLSELEQRKSDLIGAHVDFYLKDAPEAA